MKPSWKKRCEEFITPTCRASVQLRQFAIHRLSPPCLFSSAVINWFLVSLVKPEGTPCRFTGVKINTFDLFVRINYYKIRNYSTSILTQEEPPVTITFNKPVSQRLEYFRGKDTTVTLRDLII